MRSRDLLLVLAVATIWGVNFVVIDFGLESFPPLLFAALRFALVAVPAVFFVRSPGVRWWWLVAIGLLTGVGQFGLLFTGMHLGMPAGLAALVLQSQAMFTVIISAAVLRERPGPVPLAGVLVATVGIVLIGSSFAVSGPTTAFLLVVVAGACWAGANVCTRLAKPTSGFALVIWSSLVSPIPLLLMSLLQEGPARDWAALTNLSLKGVSSLAFIVVASTLVAFGIWNHLLARYPAPTVAPFSLLVPVVGLLMAWLVLAEVPTPIELAGAAAVLVGLVAVTNHKLSSFRLPRGKATAETGPDAGAAAATPTAAGPANPLTEDDR